MFLNSLLLHIFSVSLLFPCSSCLYVCVLLKHPDMFVRLFCLCSLFDVSIGRQFAIFLALLVVFGVPEGLMLSFDGTGAVVRGSVDLSFFILLSYFGWLFEFPSGVSINFKKDGQRPLRRVKK